MSDDNDFQRVALPPWVYEEDGPFKVFAVDKGTPVSQESFNRLPDAIAWFVRFHVGPIDQRDAAVVDSFKQILVGYAAYQADEVVWMGTARGFAEFAHHHDPLSVAIWERLAGGDQLEAIPTEETL